MDSGLYLNATLHFHLLHSVHFPQDFTCPLFSFTCCTLFLLHLRYASLGICLCIFIICKTFSFKILSVGPVSNESKCLLKLAIKMYEAIGFNCFFTNLTAPPMAIFQNLHFGDVLIRPVGYIMLCTRILLQSTIS